MCFRRSCSRVYPSTRKARSPESSCWVDSIAVDQRVETRDHRQTGRIRRLASTSLVCGPPSDIDRGERPLLRWHGAKGGVRGRNCGGAGHGHVLHQLSAVSQASVGGAGPPGKGRACPAPTAAGPVAAPRSSHGLHGQNAGAQPHAPLDVAGLPGRRRGRAGEQFPNRRRPLRALPRLEQGTAISGSVLAACLFRGAPQRLPPHIVHSGGMARQLDFPDHRKPGPGGVDVGGGALRHGVRYRPHLPGAVSGCGTRAGVAHGAPRSPARTSRRSGRWSESWPSTLPCSA